MRIYCHHLVLGMLLAISTTANGQDTLNAKGTMPNATGSSVIRQPLSVYQILSVGCTVKASFTPGNDTTLYTGQSINFTNTSQNADSYEWIVDTYFNYPTTNLLNFVPAVGITPIKLVAHQGNCTDTATAYVVRNGTAPADLKHMNVAYGLPLDNQWAAAIVSAKSDGYLMVGASGNAGANDYSSPYFVRVSENGCILWSRLLPQNRETQVRALITTYDSGFIAMISLREDLDKSYLIKLDKNGNTVWSHSYHGDYDLNWNGAIKEMSDHSLMLLAGNYGGKYYLLTKIDPQGVFLWQKKYLINEDDYGSFTNLVEKDGFVYLSGYYYQAVNPIANQWNQLPMLFKLDAGTGNLIWSKTYSSPNKFLSFLGIHLYKNGLIMNGFADSLVKPYNNEWTNSATIVETDLDGNLLRGTEIYNLPTELNTAIACNLVVDENNALELFYVGAETLALQPGFVNLNYYMRLDASKNILWQQTYYGSGLGYFNQAVPAPAKGLAMIGQRITPLFSAVSSITEHLILQKIDSNGVGPGCNQVPSGSQLTDLVVNPYVLGNPVVTDQSLQVLDQSQNIRQANSELRFMCPEYVPTCSFMKLSGKNFVCNLKDTLEFIAHKDPACADPVIWTYDLGNIKTVYQDGGRARMLFKTPGIYKILAEKPAPCADIFDSIMVTVAPALVNFSLGNDTTLCSGDSLVLKPVGNYNQYVWQDGSTTDSFKIKTAGVYHLMVTDSCGNTKADTIQVNFQTSIPIDLGATRNICPSDSLVINPPGSFDTYDWEPKYDMTISAVPGGAIVFPKVDTTYTLNVENSGGCRGSGQVAVHIYTTKKPVLEKDTSICADSQVQLVAMGNFVSYVWSDGETTASIHVSLAGSYSVRATDANQCNTWDTVAITVYALPVVHITGGTAICAKQPLVLDAGNGYLSYLWQDGTHNEKFTAYDTGYYRVTVSDDHQCSAADSVHVDSYSGNPKDFLPSDTVICNSGYLLLQPERSFSQYIWNTGETASSIQIKSPGTYSLQVVDAQGCSGIDSIFVTSKDCEALLVFPNAFTPNNDGLNDVFRLRYPGVVQDYQLQIFNRWGQLLFRSSDPSAGWDGNLGGAAQPTGTYIWMAHFTDNNGKKQTLRGSVVLIR